MASMPQLLPFGLEVTWKQLPELRQRAAEAAPQGGSSYCVKYTIVFPIHSHTRTFSHTPTSAVRRGSTSSRRSHPSQCGHLFCVHQDCRPNPRRIISSMSRLFMCNGSHLSPSLPPPPGARHCPSSPSIGALPPPTPEKTLSRC